MGKTNRNKGETWQQYESQIFEICKSRYPGCTVTLDQKVKGIFSKRKRQLDVAVEIEIGGERLLGVIECKHWSKKVTIPTIESFLGFLEDVNADFGYLITNHGFSEGAKNRANSPNVLLQVVKFEEFKKKGIEADDIINHKIHSLVFIKPLFLIRTKSWSSFIDSKKTSFEEKTIAFRDKVQNGRVLKYCNTEYYVYKKLMEGSARGFRDFPDIGTLTLIIPFAQTRQEYFSQVDIHDFEDFLGVNFQEIRQDIKAWRGFLGNIKKADVLSFRQKYVQTKFIIDQRYSDF